MNLKKPLLLLFYGDDFTGSTDALEFLTLARVKTALFLRTPEPKDLDRFPGIQAIGLAGKSRSMSPSEMEDELTPSFENIKRLNPMHFHYKVCSTFDSAPHVGNIGKAIEIGSTVFNQKTVMVLPAAPHLGRYCIFGNLFAKMGTIGDGEIYRIDRHPSMSNHPVTPADESDLTLHLAKQTSKSIKLVNINTIENGSDAILDAVSKNKQTEILFFDGLNNSHLSTIGTALNELAKEQTLFSVGSSGIEMALGLAWKSQNIIETNASFKTLGEAGPILVLSGSCSPVTANQITYALDNGFEEVSLTSDAVNQEYHAKIIEATANQLIANLNNGKSCILHTSIGPNDSRIAETELYFKKQGLEKDDIQKACSKMYGRILGQIAKKVIFETKLKRILFAGGDTSSYAASELNITALQMIAPLAPGAPLCKATSDDLKIDGLELNFKGGQVGTQDYFLKVFKGKKL
ncbi:four-carbon acid sugar kinase family protein [Aurantibacter crassamenti]|uniref:four-carbon acid sugar kinase family protein n=1 Tax=Aurantibacter crassamenti TaxID=1837375 RepID=UPI00193AD1C1|nr:four-carbon acid sugar kinase family protein [Aurantibacter crassamenti]MBM1105625.1 four-carbon acid sugar kinase family protein [Aurantibacter crassamenti]